MFGDRKVQRACEDARLCAKRFGQLAASVQRRLVQLRAAEVLGDVAIGNPHPLSGNRSGQFAVTISKNYRLVFEPAVDPLPLTEDGDLDLTRVTRIRILEVDDYHG